MLKYFVLIEDKNLQRAVNAMQMAAYLHGYSRKQSFALAMRHFGSELRSAGRAERKLRIVNAMKRIIARRAKRRKIARSSRRHNLRFA